MIYAVRGQNVVILDGWDKKEAEEGDGVQSSIFRKGCGSHGCVRFVKMPQALNRMCALNCLYMSAVSFVVLRHAYASPPV